MINEYIEELKSIYNSNEEAIKNGRHALRCQVDSPYNIDDNVGQYFDDIEKQNEDLKGIIDSLMLSKVLECLKD